ncbi:peptidoglycan-binding domain-containing protein [Marinobacter sp. CHS3-4]|uniref:peptidoglycan-binding domain-containing protein n=1 Tax=Marinobacter sp. CHS3-4 TaxID=3045174 RepID=UPI0024B51E4B|nr:peptidoglycan-binding domain-containing protein [Marinobacter sp. CHS3-4]MDI9246236.1 peptidoglycan-binding domain-containing protein [Marinobacter sp. CHS3-4]
MNRLTRFRSHIAAAALAGSVALAAAPSAMANDTVALKNALYGAGYAISNVSPQMDDATRQALTKFQQDNGLTASGVLDDSTKEALGMVSVQVAASNAAESSSSGSSAPETSSAASEPEPEPVEEESEDDIEEEDDGGWSFF